MTMAQDAARQANRAEVLAALEDDAEYLQPRLFAIYGFRRDVHGMGSEQPFLGWGVDLCDDEGAVFWHPEGHRTRRFSSAERALEFHQGLGEAHLTWLD